MSGHSRLSASASGRWVRCPGSIAYIEFLQKEKKIPLETTNSAAELGTALHEVLEYCIKKEVNPMQVSNKVLRKLSKIEFTSYNLGGVELYWRYIDKQRDNYRKTIAEKKYDLSIRFGTDLGGTADVTQMQKRGTLHIGDYKNGRGIVDVKDNYQLLIYALGAFVKYDERYKFKQIKMSIGQPNAKHPDGRVREDVITVDELLKWEDQYLKPAVEKIKRGTSELIPGEKQCLWCPARSHCSANAKQLVQIAQLDFKKYAEPRQDFPEVQDLTRKQIAFILDNEARLINFCKSVKEYATEIVDEGEEVGDYTLQTKLGNRRFIDDKTFKKVLKEHKVTFKSTQVEQGPKQMTVKQLEDFLAKDKKWPKDKIKSFMGKITCRPVTGKTLIKGAPIEKEFENLDEPKVSKLKRQPRTRRFRRNK